MRFLISSLTFISLICPAISMAQNAEPPLVPGARPPGQKTTTLDHLDVEDGGAHGSILESIIVPPKAKAPFTLILETTWVRPLGDGGSITTANKRKIARDADGRIYMERWWLAPPNHPEQSEMTTIQISDPVAHTHINCFMMDPKKQCQMSTFEASTDSFYDFFGPNGKGRTANKIVGEMGDTEWIDLGKQYMAGVDTIGRHVISHFNPGAFGNDRMMTIEREFWYSPKLGFNMLSKRSDPRYGVQTFTVTNLVLSDPDPQLYELPEGYSLVDKRKILPPEY
jgi:hypothetical protein